MRKAVLLALLVCGCSSWNKGDVGHIQSSGFNSKQDLMIQQAASDWEDALSQYITFDIFASESHTITIEARTLEELKDETGADVWGRTNWNSEQAGGDIELAIDATDKDFAQSARHEFGHALGLQHSGPGTMMFLSMKHQSRTVTCEDVEQFCELWDCDSTTMKSCR